MTLDHSVLKGIANKSGNADTIRFIIGQYTHETMLEIGRELVGELNPAYNFSVLANKTEFTEFDG